MIENNTSRGITPRYVIYSLVVYLVLLSSAVVVVGDKPPPQTQDIKECSESDGVCKDPTTTTTSSVYVIGDLHGDAICAISWVNRTGLIANLLSEEISSTDEPLYKILNNPSEWKWTNDQATLVFMGDYVDKGPTAKQVVHFVKDLTTTFPKKVTAILGNHELELLRDRDARITPVERYSAYSYATVHPGDYHNYLSVDEKDDLVLDQLLEASMEVYAHNAHSAVRIVPSLPKSGDVHTRRGVQYAITDIIPPQHRDLAVERLTDYQTAYLDTFRSGTPLGSWLESRPIAHLAENINTLFVHGGVNHNTGKSYFANGKEGVDKLNAAWWDHSHEDKLFDFLDGKKGDLLGYVVYELLTYRGNHPGYAQWESKGSFDDGESDGDQVCKVLHDMLSHMDGINRIAVGHTPNFNVRILCDGEFLALDSTLGRWIRGSGNMYCAGPEHHKKRKDFPMTSRDGRFACDEIKEVCEGQTTRLDSDGSVNVLAMQ